MKFSIIYEAQMVDTSRANEARCFHEIVEQSLLAEAMGFDTVWAVEHTALTQYAHMSAPETFLAFLAGKTTRLGIGHGVVCLPPAMNHPVKVAERIATLDLVSNGRVDFGTGESSSLAELGGFDESMDVLEDQKIAADIRRRGRWVLLPGKMQTSARRFEAAGFHRLYILMSIMQAMYWTGATEFFDRAPGIYRQQQEVGKLLLTPFFREIALMFREDYGVAGTLRLLVGVGRFVRSHSWQMFYFVDICLRPITGPGRYPFLRFHDAVFWKITNFRVFDGLAAILTVGWFLGVLFPVYTFLDRRELRADQGRTTV